MRSFAHSANITQTSISAPKVGLERRRGFVYFLKGTPLGFHSTCHTESTPQSFWGHRPLAPMSRTVATELPSLSFAQISRPYGVFVVASLSLPRPYLYSFSRETEQTGCLCEASRTHGPVTSRQTPRREAVGTPKVLRLQKR